ncbi:protein of unknown function [Pseudomonas sp. JV551A1]|uniref:Uncharacterized protein n=1 Tax=Pseudomonas inefficax TaxID=2078786 RepID=A0AAQ1ST24_9PSED|nr:protein of unknown function [Pseudomonas sp. JV551A1]SPO60492.1 protein of unknown function [Pseudomonas inefficax]
MLVDLHRPLRGHARSHRDTTPFKFCGIPVGAGVPAKKLTRIHFETLVPMRCVTHRPAISSLTDTARGAHARSV